MKLFDTHCDTAVRCYNGFQPDGGRTPLYENDFHISLKKAEAFERYIQLFAIWDHDDMEPEACFFFFQRVYANFMEELQQNASRISLYRQPSDFDACTNLALLSVENGKLLNGKIERLEHLYDCGVRLMTLVWNGSNCIGNGVLSGDQGGLTAFGKDVVRHMNQIGMVVDVSHLNDSGFYDVVRHASVPFVASHSNSRAVCHHPRNLTDEQIEIIGEQGGLIGLNFSASFLSSEKVPPYEQLLRHIDRILERGGEECLCIGADFDGTDVPEALNGLSMLPALYDHLKNSGLGVALTDKIFYKNAFQFFKNVL